MNCAAIRREADNGSDMTAQLRFEETFHILDQNREWYRIYSDFDHYEGWVLKIQVKPLQEGQHELLRKDKPHCSRELISLIVDDAGQMQVVTLGASLPFYSDGSFRLGDAQYTFDGEVSAGVSTRADLVRTAHQYLNAPFLWGGRTPIGIDSSGFTQMVYKINGLMLYRDAHQQASQGEVLSFIEECEPGDLAFFDNEEGEIVHVGIILAHNHIIHCHGKVRIDRIDHSGIYNVDTERHTHKLRVMKRILE